MFRTVSSPTATKHAFILVLALAMSALPGACSDVGTAADAADAVNAAVVDVGALDERREPPALGLIDRVP